MKRPNRHRRVLVIGWDGADWKVINALIEQGKMPHTAKLIERGVMGDLATLSPPLSPMLWTSIATGKRPFKHGVLGFVEPRMDGLGINPVGILSRKTRALWNMLTLEGKTSNVIGWWPSHPAEPIRGVCVTNHFQQAVAPLDQPWPLRPSTVHPPRLQEPLQSLRVHPGEITPEQLLMFVPDAASIDQKKDQRLATIAKTLAECASIQAAATALVQLEPWDFMAVYFDAIDHFSHGFMTYHPPRMDKISEEDFQLYHGVIEAAYRFHDAMLGVLLGLVDEDTTVLLISDHGFHPDALRPTTLPSEPAGPAAQHRTHGIFVAAGPGIKQDERIYGASILDITPTILTLFGLPVGEDMDGKALLNIFATPPEFSVIPSWDAREGAAGEHPPDTALDPIEAGEMIEQLAGLGYIDAPEDGRAAAQSARTELQYNLARSYMHGHRHLDAARLLETLHEADPDETRFGLHLVQCYNTLERCEEGAAVLEDTIARLRANQQNAVQELKTWKAAHPDTKPKDLDQQERRRLQKLQSRAAINPEAILLIQGDQEQAAGRYEKALNLFREAEKLRPESLLVLTRLGRNRFEAGEHDAAETYFQRVLEQDPHDAGAWLAVARCMMTQQRHWEAVGTLLHSIGLHYYNPPCHYLLGQALLHTGRITEAMDAWRVCLAQNPNYAEAYDQLAKVYRNRLQNETEARAQEQRGREARERIARIKNGTAEATGVHIGRTPYASDQADIQLATPPQQPLASDTLIIVSGLPRSGTSMMMHMLQAGGIALLIDDQRQANPGNLRGFFEYAPVKASMRDTAWLDQAPGKAVKVVAPLLTALPPSRLNDCRIILMERDLDQVVASQRRLLELEKQTGARLPDAVLRKHLGQRLHAAKRFLALLLIPTLVMPYQDCLQDPVAAAHRVALFLGGQPDANAMAQAIDPALATQTAPVS